MSKPKHKQHRSYYTTEDLLILRFIRSLDFRIYNYKSPTIMSQYPSTKSDLGSLTIPFVWKFNQMGELSRTACNWTFAF